MKLKLNQKVLPRRERYVFQSPTFQLALENAFCSLETKYVPIEHKRTIEHYIKFILRMAENTNPCDLNNLYRLQDYLRSSKTYLPQKYRALLKDIHNSISNGLPFSSASTSSSNSSSSSSSSSPSSPSGVSSISEELEQLNLEEEKVECFCGLVYRTTVHPALMTALESTDVYKWYPEPEKCTITAFGASSVIDFRNHFSEVWDLEKDKNGLKFPSELVLSFIKYVETTGSTVSPCTIQGTTLSAIQNHLASSIRLEKGTIGGFLHLGDEKLYCITAAHCITNPEEDNVPFINTEEIDIALVPLKKTLHESFFTDESDHFKIPTAPTEDSSDIKQGIEVIKIGATSGITRGLVFGLNRHLKLSLGPFAGTKWRNMIEILGIPGQPFARHGDSGSIVYAVEGKDWVPIAVLRGQEMRKATESTDEYMARERSMFAYATPLHKIRDVIALVVTETDEDVDQPAVGTDQAAETETAAKTETYEAADKPAQTAQAAEAHSLETATTEDLALETDYTEVAETAEDTDDEDDQVAMIICGSRECSI